MCSEDRVFLWGTDLFDRKEEMYTGPEIKDGWVEGSVMAIGG